jgi:hypothetical protein
VLIKVALYAEMGCRAKWVNKRYEEIPGEDLILCKR